MNKGGRYSTVSIARLHAGNRRQISPGRLDACLRCLSSVPINIKPHSTSQPRVSPPSSSLSLSRSLSLSLDSTYTPVQLALSFTLLRCFFSPSLPTAHYFVWTFFALVRRLLSSNSCQIACSPRRQQPRVYHFCQILC